MPAVRKLTKQDEAAYYRLLAYTGQGGHGPTGQANFGLRFEHSASWGIGRPLAAALLGTHFNVDFAGTTYRTAGLGNLAYYPEAYTDDTLAALMRAAFASMQQTGETLAYIKPFSASVLRQFGFEVAFDQMTHRLAARDLPPLPKPQSAAVHVVRRAYAEAIPALAALYSRSKEATRGGLQRPTWWWQYQAGRQPHVEVAMSLLGEHPSGYLLYQRDGTTLRLHELFYDDLASLLALGQFVFALRPYFETIVFTTGNLAPLHDLLPEPAVLHSSRVPAMMARIIDLPAFMRRYPYQISDLAPTVVAVQDDFLPVNGGLWQLTIDDGQAHFARAKAGEPAVSLSEQQLVKAAFGVRSLQEAYALGLVDGDAYAISAMNDIFVAHQAQLYDTV